ncbi:unnamed protein product [Meganyctiphanes norvegica]|uniref:DNA-directed RNA polymerase subunit n=1 Tax=Meganyctiphanes norvegica TaxID=48144 RepID=A0AAV2PPX1_MEGNR
MGSYGQLGFTTIDDLLFRIYTEDEIKKISLLRITNDQSFNELGHIAQGGVYDLRMGPGSMRDRSRCETCGFDGMKCQGHCGHIELPLPVYNPFFYDFLREILPRICWECKRYQSTNARKLQLIKEVQLCKAGYPQDAFEVVNIVSRSGNSKECEEVTTGVDDREIKVMESGDYLLDLHEDLEKFYKKVVKEGLGSSETCTSNSKAVQTQLVRAFLDETKPKKCSYCNVGLRKLQLQNSRFMIKNTGSRIAKPVVSEEQEEEINKYQQNLVDDAQSYITPEQTMTVLREVWREDFAFLKILYPVLAGSLEEYPTDMFFINKLLVIPPKYRPCNFQDGMMIEHEASVLLKNVVLFSKCLNFLVSVAKGTISELPDTITYILSQIPGKTNQEKSQVIWNKIQSMVDNLLDANLNKIGSGTSRGIKQVIEKKEGLFRSNLMGKRVNFSARSVAAPDPFLSVDEIGVPLDFAIGLSYPAPVTPWNVDYLRNLVINGPHVYPGARWLVDEEGQKKDLRVLDLAQRTALAKELSTAPPSTVRKKHATKIVYRHLMQGDYVLMNRQPTLHRPSIQAHKARIMPKDRVLRMPYANCKAYNADFDGDELNMHFPQNELARSEALNLITTHNQYLTPKDGAPLAGLIQDCVVASVMLTVRGKFFTQEDYQQLIFVALSDKNDRIRLLTPTIIKPKRLWSGKQVISTLIHNIISKDKAKPTFDFKTSVKVDLWKTDEPREWKAGGTPEKRKEVMTESQFVMREGELMCGVVDKSAIGSTSYGLVHVCYDLYGGNVATRLMSAINRLCVYYLQWVGHTISVKEFVTPKKVSKKRRKTLKDLVERTRAEVSKKLKVPEEEFCDYFEKATVSGNQQDIAAIDAAYTAVLGPTTSEVTAENERGLYRRGLDNHMRMMVDTGAKGSKVNMNQMASLFGSVAIDGKRMPISITGKFLPSFKPYESNPRAGGYIPTRFMTGMDPQAYFFLCVVGRDSLQHTAVKTANSGYMQRCLIKHLEGIQVKYDMTVRNSDGLVLQFGYGEDGGDVSKFPFLKTPETLDVVVNSCQSFIDKKTIALTEAYGNQEEVIKYRKKVKKWEKNNKDKNKGLTPFQRFCKKMEGSIDVSGYCTKTGRSNASLKLQKMWIKLDEEEKEKYKKKGSKQPDPINSVFSGSSNLGVVSEALESLIDDYYDNFYSKIPRKMQKMEKDDITKVIHMKAMRSQVDPGEAVGALCAQAIGEPLTQMTLNTFHFAGRDELNVTLGVPRMVEILRTASENISTPIMSVPFKSDVSPEKAELIRKHLSRLSLDKVLHRLDVNMRLARHLTSKTNHVCKVKFTFLPHKQYKHMFPVNPAQVLSFMEDEYINKYLIKEIQKSLGMTMKSCSTTLDKESPKAPSNEDEEVDEDATGGTEDLSRTNSKKGISAESEESSEEDDDTELRQDADVVTSARRQKATEQDYEDGDLSEEDDAAANGGSEPVSEDEGLGEDVAAQESSDEEQAEYKAKSMSSKKSKCLSEETVLKRRNKVTSQSNWIHNYEFDTQDQIWCEVTLILPLVQGKYDIPSIVRKTTQKALVHHTTGIKRAFVVDNDGTLTLRTEGVNEFKIFELNHYFDVNKLYTNNIHGVAKMYGIEAAQRAIIREILEVQSAYDIKVDFRHLSLLADYFTCEGVYKACSRQALASNLSPLQKMSYETCTKFLVSSILQGESDKMNSPSACVAVGQPIKVGTNSMCLLPVLKV